MDLFGSLINDRGCGVDGATTSNPIVNVVDQILHAIPMGRFETGPNEEIEQGVLLNENSFAERRLMNPYHGMYPPFNEMQNTPWLHDFSNYHDQSHMIEQQQMNAEWSRSGNMSVPDAMSSNFMSSHIPSPMNMFQFSHPSPYMNYPSVHMMPLQNSGMMNSHQYNYQPNQMAVVQEVNTVENEYKESSNVEELKNEEYVEDNTYLNKEFSNEIQQLWETGGSSAVEAHLQQMWKSEMMKSDNELSSFKNDKALENQMENGNIMDSSKVNMELAWHEILKNLENSEGNYIFSTKNNKFLQDNNNDSDVMFQKGLEYFELGKIPEAIEAFESVLMKDMEYSEAWSKLGLCHAENDDDKKAITCLIKAKEFDPYNLEALLCLGISYVNETNSLGALDSLRAWVTHHPKFHGIKIKQDDYSDGSLMDEVSQLMLEALAWTPNDTDVLIVLGVLYNVSQNFQNAIQCFEKALEQKPHDYSLLNKLGATLANSNRSTEAIPWYARALELRPAYVRGWLNLGISYSNLSQSEDAARSYLQALKLNKDASHIWAYLRTCFTNMNRYDLIDLMKDGDIDKLQIALEDHI
eukprot:gene4750-9432_t